MKIKNKIIAGILSVILPLSFVGCTIEKSDTESSSNSSGRYVEEEIILPAMVNGMSEFFYYDGVPAFLDFNNGYLYRENEKKTSFTAVSFKLPKTNMSCFAWAASSEGEVYTFYTIDPYSEENNEILCGIGKPDEEWRDFLIRDFNFVQTAECSTDGKFFGVTYDFDSASYHIVKIDTVAEKSDVIFTYPNSDNVLSFDIVGNYIISVFGEDILFYNYVSETLEETPEAIQTFIGEQRIAEMLNMGERKFDICAGEDNTMYIVCESGLYRYVINGNQVEQLIDGITCHIGNPSWNINSVIQENNNSFIISYDNTKIMRYSYDKNAGREYDSELNIFSFSKNETAMYAIDEYRSLYPNVSINYKIAEKNFSDYNEVMEQLNAELISDNPPDVIITDDIDIDNLIENNMLLNLADHENEILSEENILENISRPLNNGGWYTMPCKFSLPYIAGKNSEIKEISDLSEFIELNKKQYSEIETMCNTWCGSHNELLEITLPFVWNDIVLENEINFDRLKQFLSDCRKYTELLMERSYRYTSNTLYLCRDFIYYFDEYQSAFASHADNVKDLMTLETLNIAEGSAGYRMDLGIKNGYIPSCSLSICSKSENTDNALRFLQTAVSENVQGIESQDGLPVNTAVIERWPNRKYRTQNTFNDNETTLYTSGKMTNINNLRGELFEEVYTMIRNLNNPLCDKGNIKEAILIYSEQYLYNLISIDEAVNKIKESVGQ